MVPVFYMRACGVSARGTETFQCQQSPHKTGPQYRGNVRYGDGTGNLEGREQSGLGHMTKTENEYNHKRNFDITPEPPDESTRSARKKNSGREFVVQKHAARSLHYDFRLELDGTLVSWAIPKGPSLDPSEKRLAVHVEDHPLSYRHFEGNIPKGQYGGGDVIVWDRGTWEPEGDPKAAYKAGKLAFTLRGEKLTGAWILVRTRARRSSDKEQWLLIKSRDESAIDHEEYDVVSARPESVVSGELLPGDRDRADTPMGNAAVSTVGKPEGTRESSAGRSKKDKGKTGGPVAGVSISSPERIIDSQSGVSKWELAAFYERIADWLVPHLAGRPVSLLRAPEGIDGEQFFQKHAQHLAIPDIRHLDKSLDPGHASLMEIDSRKALIGAVQMGTIEFHTWGASTDRIERPDRLILDLDPDPELPWQRMIEATQRVLSLLDELGLESWIKTSGGKGTHIIIPLARYADWDQVKAFAKAIAEFMAVQSPEHFTARMGPKNRVGKIFTDYLRNHRGASTVAAYSVRARPGLPVSVPITRSELEQLESAAQWTVSNLEERLEKLKDDPAQGCSNRQRITAAMWHALNAREP